MVCVADSVRTIVNIQKNEAEIFMDSSLSNLIKCHTIWLKGSYTIFRVNRTRMLFQHGDTAMLQAFFVPKNVALTLRNRSWQSLNQIISVQILPQGRNDAKRFLRMLCFGFGHEENTIAAALKIKSWPGMQESLHGFR